MQVSISISIRGRTLTVVWEVMTDTWALTELLSCVCGKYRSSKAACVGELGNLEEVTAD